MKILKIAAISLIVAALSLPAYARGTEKNPFERDLKEIQELKEDYEKATREKARERIGKNIEAKEKALDKKVKARLKPLEDRQKKLNDEIDKLKEKNRDASKKEAELKKNEEEIAKIENWAEGKEAMESPEGEKKDTQSAEDKAKDALRRAL